MSSLSLIEQPSSRCILYSLSCTDEYHRQQRKKKKNNCVSSYFLFQSPKIFWLPLQEFLYSTRRDKKRKKETSLPAHNTSWICSTYSTRPISGSAKPFFGLFTLEHFALFPPRARTLDGVNVNAVKCRIAEQIDFRHPAAAVYAGLYTPIYGDV